MRVSLIKSHSHGVLLYPLVIIRTTQALAHPKLTGQNLVPSCPHHRESWLADRALHLHHHPCLTIDRSRFVFSISCGLNDAFVDPTFTLLSVTSSVLLAFRFDTRFAQTLFLIILSPQPMLAACCRHLCSFSKYDHSTIQQLLIPSVSLSTKFRCGRADRGQTRAQTTTLS